MSEEEVGRQSSLVAFFVESGPIGYAGVEKANVYVVKMVGGVYPFAAGIVGLEVEVWRKGPALAGREIGSWSVLLAGALKLVGSWFSTDQSHPHRGIYLRSRYRELVSVARSHEWHVIRGPYSNPSADVYDFLGVLQRGEEQLVVERQKEYVVTA